MNITSNNKIIFLFIVLMIFSWLYPVYFVADDWEHLNAYYGVGPDVYLRPWLFRLPGLYITHQLIFPLFKNELFFLGNFLCWSFLFSGLLLILDYLNVLKKLLSEPLWFFVSFFFMLAFNGNNFEWLFWPTVMVNFPGFFAVGLGLWLTKNSKHWFRQVIKGILWGYGFYCYESLFFMGVLIQVSGELLKNRKFKDSMIPILKQLFISILFLVISKSILSSIESYGYVSKVGFKKHLFTQSMSLIFLHDYYKTRWLTGGINLLAILFLLWTTFRSLDRKSLLNKALPILIVFMVSISYYFVIMDYSARRAIGGQVFFSWGCLSLMYLNIKWKTHKNKIDKAVLILFPLCWILHFSYVTSIKAIDKRSYQENIVSVKKRISTSVNKLSVTREEMVEGVETGWNVVNKDQERGWIKHVLTKEEIEKVSF